MRRLNAVRIHIFAASILLAAPLSSERATAGDYGRLSKSDLRTLQASFSDLADEVGPSVVSIRTYHAPGGEEGFGVLRTLSQGTGVIIRADGYILTNYHVIESANKCLVVLHNGHEFEGDIIQSDTRADLAVLKIDAQSLKAARFGSLENVRVGHWTFAIGNPFGMANFDGRTSFTVGNVSSIGKNLTAQLDPDGEFNRYYGNLIETSSTINPGNSGGPLFNVDGDVIGIVTAIETQSGAGEGLGYAIPISDRTRAIIEKLVHGEEVRYGFLGVTTMDGDVGRSYSVGGRSVRGAVIARAYPGRPAYLAGIREDDVIIELAGTPIEDSDHLVRVVGCTPIGAEVPALYVRRGEQHVAKVKLVDREQGLATARRLDR